MEAGEKPVFGRICLCVLCGLPASGKSTLAQTLKVHLHNKSWESCLLCYDELIPDDAYSLKEGDDGRQKSDWRSHRRVILQFLEGFLQRTLTPQPHCGEGETSHLTREMKTPIMTALQIAMRAISPNATSLVVLLDDNFFYQSMRYEVHQLARKYSLAFCQLYLCCPLDLCLYRNRARTRPLPDDVIVEMEKRMEPPNPDRNAWEQNSVTLPSHGGFSTHHIEVALQLMTTALENPLTPVNDETELKEADRLRCASSTVHRADQVCRRLVSRAMQVSKDSKLAPVDMRSLAKELNLLKSRILEDLRKQLLSIYTISPGESLDVEKVVRGAVAMFEEEKRDILRRYYIETVPVNIVM